MEASRAITLFLEHLQHGRGRSAGTVDTYLGHLERLVAFLETRGTALLAATREDVAIFLGLHLHQLGIAPRSRRPAVAAVRGFYRFAHARAWVRENIARDVGYPRSAERLPEVLQPAHVEQLMQACDIQTLKGIRDAAIFGVVAGCGLRVAGLVGLNQSDVRTERDDRGRERGHLRVREKGDRERLVPLPDDALLLIRAYLGHPGLDSIDRRLPDGDEVLFVNLWNNRCPRHEAYGERRRLTTNGVRMLFVRVGAKAGIDRRYLHPHAARHLFGVELAEGDVDLHRRMALMGHRSVESSLLYNRMALRVLRQAVDRAGPLSRIQTPVTALRDALRTGG